MRRWIVLAEGEGRRTWGVVQEDSAEAAATAFIGPCSTNVRRVYVMAEGVEKTEFEVGPKVTKVER